jgi:hypothetical protein
LYLRLTAMGIGGLTEDFSPLGGLGGLNEDFPLQGVPREAGRGVRST